MERRFSSLLVSPKLPQLLALLAVILTLPSLWGGLQFDDYLLEKSVREAPGLTSAVNRMFVFMDGDVRQAQSNMEAGTYPWFTLPNGKVAFWRPLSALTHWLDFRLFPDVPVLMHVQNILWFALGVFLITLFFREFLPAPAAGLAALFFTLDDAHGYAVGWISNRNVLMAFSFGVLSLLLYHWHTMANIRARSFLLIASAVSFSLSLLSAEAGLGIIGYFIAYLLTQPKKSRWIWLTLTPHVLILFGWAYFYRLGGYGGWGTSYIDPARELTLFLLAVLERAPVLWLGFILYPPAELYPFVSSLWLRYLWVGTGLGLMLFLGKKFYLLAVQNTNLRFFFIGSLLSLPLICSSLPANRLLFFLGIGGFALLAVFLVEASEQVWITRPLWMVHLFVAGLLLPVASISPRLFGEFEPAILSAPVKPTVVFVSAPSAFHADFFRLIRTRFEAKAPERVWYLGTGLSAMTVYRPSETTLIVQSAEGYITGFDAVFRGAGHPMQKGEIVELNGLQVTVQELTSDGRPAVVVFKFAEPLESTRYQWLVWETNRLVEWRLPEIGQSVEVR